MAIYLFQKEYFELEEEVMTNALKLPATLDPSTVSF